uniref:Wzz/FepE/Etk N-terminal domain-containing protein n=1 Tax=Methylobacterium sp. B34 TaxID=95563 RepID=UPI000347F1FA|nr:Wzz/FepE/Etk N-terminal domain-containing protein [Methylobacterium sp. B34]
MNVIGPTQHNSSRFGNDIASLINFAVESARLFAILVALFGGIGALYAFTATNTYTASSLVIVEPKYSSWSNAVSGNLNTQMVVDSGQLESQIQLIKSAAISGKVYRALQLGKAGGIFSTQPGIFSRFKSIFAPNKESLEATENDAENIDLLAKMIAARRVGQSYVIEISFNAGDPQTASRICNSVTAAYIADRLNSRIEAAENGSEILKTRIDILQRQQAVLESAVRSGEFSVDALPSADARVISAALPPIRPSWPRKGYIIIFSMGLGAFVALLVSLARSRQS